MNKDLQSLGNSEALIVEARAYLNALPQSQAEQGFLISRLMAQLSALQSDNDTLRAALERIKNSTINDYETRQPLRIAAEALSTTRGRG